MFSKKYSSWLLLSIPKPFKARESIQNFEGLISVIPLQILLSLQVILLGREASFLGFLTWDPSLIWNTDLLKTKQ